MGNRTTELVFIIDQSGSMYGLETDTIGGFNSVLDRQREESGCAYVSTVLFNDRCQVIHDRENIKNISHMRRHDYRPSGSTALYDAVGGAIHHISNIHKYAKKRDIPDKTLFVIITDGMENSSRNYNAYRIREMISQRKEKYGWEFLFLGANMDVEAAAEDMGIGSDRAVRYCCDRAGTEISYEAVNNTVSCFRTSGVIGENWKESIERDEKLRGKKS